MEDMKGQSLEVLDIFIFSDYRDSSLSEGVVLKLGDEWLRYIYLKSLEGTYIRDFTSDLRNISYRKKSCDVYRIGRWKPQSIDSVLKIKCKDLVDILLENISKE